MMRHLLFVTYGNNKSDTERATLQKANVKITIERCYWQRTTGRAAENTVSDCSANTENRVCLKQLLF